MALNKRPVELDFTNGVDRSTDEFLTIPSKLQTLVNGEFGADRNSIQTRDGWQKLISGGAYSTEAPSTIKRMYSRDGETLVESDTGLHTCDVAGNKFQQVVRNLTRCSAELESIVHATEHVMEADTVFDSVSGLQCTVYALSVFNVSRPQIWLLIQRGDVVVQHTRLNNATYWGYHPVCLYYSNKFYVYWIEDTTGLGNWTVNSAVVSTASPATAPTVHAVEGHGTGGVTVAGGMDATVKTYNGVDTDAGKTAAAIYLAHAAPGSGAGETVRILRLSISDGYTIQSHSESGAKGGAGHDVRAVRVVITDGLGIFGTDYAVAYALWSTATPGDGLVVSQTFLDIASPPAATNDQTLAFNPSGKISVLKDPTTVTRFWCVWGDGNPAKTFDTLIRGFAGRMNGAMDYTSGFAPAILVRSLDVATDLFVFANRVYVGGYFLSDLQPTHLVVQVGGTGGAISAVSQPTGETCARITCGATPPLSVLVTPQGRVPKAQVIGTTVVTCVARAGDDYVVAATGVTTVNVTRIGQDRLTLDFSAQLNQVQMDHSLILAGADPQVYDGASVVEAGFEYYPEQTQCTDIGGGSLNAGVYGICAIYEWIDNRGVKHQSAPSVVQNLTVGANGKIRYKVPTLRVTRKTDVRILVFRTTCNGSVFYRYEGAGVKLTNDVTADTVQTGGGGASPVDDTISDTLIAGGELLPTTGGVVPNQSYPACKYVAQHQDRLFFSGLENKHLIQYTEEAQLGFFPGTNAVYTQSVPTEGLRVSALWSMDDKLIVFQEKHIDVMFGRGPNRLGLQNEYSAVTKVLGGVGHSWAESSVCIADPDGIWFRDPLRGLRHFNRGMQLSLTNDQSPIPAGSEVDDLITATLAAPAILNAKKQIRFPMAVSSPGQMLVWDYENKQWCVFKSAALSVGQILGLTSTNDEVRFFDSSQTWKEDTTTSLDGAFNLAPTMDIRTSWLKLNSLAGLQRVYSVQVVGKFKNSKTGSLMAGSINIGSNINYRTGLGDQAADSVSYANDYSDVNNSNVDFTQHDNQAFQIEHQLASQKCESIQVVIQATLNYGARITGISLQIGQKRGMFKHANRE